MARKLSAMEKNYDAQFKVVLDTLRQLMFPVEPKPRNRFLVKYDDGKPKAKKR
jgi:hypothetical protein